MRQLRKVRGVENELKPEVLASAPDVVEDVPDLSPGRPQVVPKVSPERPQKESGESRASHYKFLTAHGLRRVILFEVAKNIFERDGKFLSYINRDEVKKLALPEYTSKGIRNTIYNLKEEGWWSDCEDGFVEVNIKNYRH